MKYTDFLKTAERLGEGARVITNIRGAEINDAKLHKEDGWWHICQNTYDDSNCDDMLGYKYSHIIYDDEEAEDIEYLLPLTKTLNDLEQGDYVIDGIWKMKMLGRCGDVYLMSVNNSFDQFGKGYTAEDLKYAGYEICQPEPSQPELIKPETLTIEGKTYNKNEVVEKLKELKTL